MDRAGKSGPRPARASACRNAVEGRPYAIPFTGETDLIFVDDVAAAFEAALLRPISGAHVFNLRGEIAGVDAIMAQIRSLVPGAQLTAEGAPVPIKADIEAHDLTPVLGPLPTTSLSEGLRRTVRWRSTRTPLAPPPESCADVPPCPRSRPPSSTTNSSKRASTFWS